MPKLKTHKGAAKRFKKTGTGKVKRHHSHLRHMLTSKNKKRKGKLSQAVRVPLPACRAANELVAARACDEAIRPSSLLPPAAVI